MKPSETKEYYPLGNPKEKNYNQNYYEPNLRVAELAEIAAKNKLKLMIEEPIQAQDRVISITNKRLRTMSVVALRIFLEEQSSFLEEQALDEKESKKRLIKWVDDVESLPPPTDSKELHAFEQTRSCLKGLLQTDTAGLVLTNLREVKKDAYVCDYAGELIISYSYLELLKANKPNVILRLLGSPSYLKATNRYQYELDTVEYGNHGRLAIGINSEFHRGDGSYLLHVYSLEELNYLYTLPKNHGVLTETVTSEIFPFRIFFKALAKLPSFTPLACSYGLEYWFNGNQDPVLFDRNGFEIKEKFPIRNYYVRIMDNPFGHRTGDYVELQGSLESIIKSMQGSQTQKGIVFNESHFQSACLYNNEKQRYELPRIYNEIVTFGTTPAEYCRAAVSVYTAINSSLGEYKNLSIQGKLDNLQYAVDMYRKAIVLWLADKQKIHSEEISVCAKSIKKIEGEIKQTKEVLKITSSASRSKTPATQSLSNPCQQAIAKGDLKQLHLLLTLSQINKQNPEGRTLLHEAALGGQLLICAYLLVAKADPEIRDHQQKRPIDYCIGKNSNPLIWRMLNQTHTMIFTDRTLSSLLSK